MKSDWTQLHSYLARIAIAIRELVTILPMYITKSQPLIDLNHISEPNLSDLSVLKRTQSQEEEQNAEDDESTKSPFR